MNKFKKTGVTLLSLGSIFAIVACGGSSYSREDFGSIDDVISHAKTISSKDNTDDNFEKTGTPNFAVPEEGYDGSEVELTFYSTQGQSLKAITDKYIEEFNKIYPNIKVTHTSIGSYDDVRDQIKTEIPVKNQPNIAYCYPDHVALYNLSKAVAHLDNFIDSTVSDGNGGVIGLTDAQKADFITGYYNEGRQFGDGLMYSMPFSKSTEVLYYNKDVFDANALEVPTHWFSESDSDTTSMEYVCEVLKKKYQNDIPLGYDSEANWMITMAEQCGADYTVAAPKEGESHFKFDNPTMKAIAKRFNKWYQEGWMTTQQLYGAYTSGLFIADGSDKAPTRSFMSIGSSAGANHQLPGKNSSGNYPFQVGITSIPQMSATNKKVISQGPSVCIFKKSNPQEVVASWLLVKYLTTSVQYQAEFGKASGYVPVLKSVASDPTYSSFIANADLGNDYATALAAKVCLEQEDAYYTSPAFNGSSMARDQIGKALTKILPKPNTDDGDLNAFINEVFDDAIKECEQSI
ncbi:MAG: extracellular solute-binding protein [Bacilli bacterium]|nr:extracellular solute-binding protein [Bacilli bacterium]